MRKLFSIIVTVIALVCACAKDEDVVVALPIIEEEDTVVVDSIVDDDIIVDDKDEEKPEVVVIGNPVDLGLPSGLLWADLNVGASKPSGMGDSFAWGEIAKKEWYTWNSYRYSRGAYNKLTKYCTLNSYGQDGGKVVANWFVDTLNILEATDDVAATIWGEGWRIPTCENLAELLEECACHWTTKYGDENTSGLVVVSRINGDSIFLPAAGLGNRNFKDGVGSCGNYWTASLEESAPCVAKNLYFRADTFYVDQYYRSFGFSIRPVRNK